MNKPKPLEKPMTNAELADEIERQIFWEDDIDNADTFARGVHLDREQWQQIIAALRQPSDKMLVPREPTMAMLSAGKQVWLGARSLEDYVLAVYRAMLTAAEGHHE